MNSITLALVIFGIMLVFTVIRVPISVAMFAAGSVGYVMQTGWGPFSSFLNSQAVARFASYELSVIPLFILMGDFAAQGGISKALYSFAAGLMGCGWRWHPFWRVQPLERFAAHLLPLSRPSPACPCQRLSVRAIQVVWPPARWLQAVRSTY